MANAGEMILQEFHNFKGITIGNRGEELFILLRKYQQQIQQPEIDFLIQHFNPSTYLEQKMFVNIIIYFKREEELLELFLEGKENLNQRLWKHSWFFEKLLQRSTIETIVDEILPQLSYVTRIKFLKNVIFYTKEEHRIDKLYDTVFEKYGDSNAQYVLAGCSLEKILQASSLGSIVNFSNKQIIFLLRNKKNHLSKLVNMSVKHDINIFDFFDRHSKALNVIGGNDFNIFMEIFRQKNCLKLGKRLTEKIVKREMSFLFECEGQNTRNLHQRTLYRSLGKNFKNFLYSTWPSSFSSFRLNIYPNPMKFCPKKDYLEIIQEGLHKKYNTSLSEHPELISDVMLDNVENIELRESLLELKMKEFKEDYTLPKYYRIDTSVPILKKKISAADGVKTRENLVIALVQTCKINNDVDALLKIQEYFNFRHKNDDQSIKTSFLCEMKNCFDLATLTESHWKLIMDLLKWNKVKNETFWQTSEFLMLHLKFLFKNNTDMSVINKLFVDSYLTDILGNFNSSMTLINDVPDLQEYLLKVLLNALSSLPPKENDKKINAYFEVFDFIQEWNKRNSKNAINCFLYPEIKEAIKTRLKGKKCWSYSKEARYFNDFITRKIHCDEISADLERWFWDNLSDKFELNLIHYYLRRNPMRVVEHFDDFISCLEHQYLYESLTMWRLIKHYDHLSLVEKIIDHLISNKKLELCGTLDIALATLLKDDEYTKLIAKYKTEMLDVDDEKQVENHRLAINLLQNAKFNNSFKILPTVVEFCAGDSLHEALPSLYYYFQHTPEKYLPENLQTLSARAVSVRKHAVKLACSVSSVEVVYTLISAFTEAEKNNSVLEHTYWKTFKYFRTNKSERFWILLQSQLESLDILESNAFKESCDLKKIPKQYRLPFLTFVWNLLDRTEKEGKDVVNFKQDLIGSIAPEMFKELSYEFCSQFIKAEFLKYGSKSQGIVRSFGVNCLKYSTHKESLIIDIFDVILAFKKHYILNPDFKISTKSFSYVDSFVEDIVDEHIDLEVPVLKKIFEKWQEIFSPIEDINNYIRLTFLVKLRKLETVDDYVLKVSELYTQFLSDFGTVGVAACFRKALRQMLPSLSYDTFDTVRENEMFYEFALRLAEVENNDLKLLAISLLPNENIEDFCPGLYQKLLDAFTNTDNKAILINFNLYLRTLG